MQKLIVEYDLRSFDDLVNKYMAENWNIVPGTNNSNHLFGEIIFLSIVLWSNQQIIITGENIYEWKEEVNIHLNNGYFVVPGTTYMTDFGLDGKMGETVHTLILNKE